MAGKKEIAADPVRSLGLLWGTFNKPSRSGLTVEAIVAAAIEIADAEGIGAVSMRHVAERLNVGTMSLYTHVPGKKDLTELMIDASLGQLYEDVDAPSRAPGGWRGALEFVAQRNFGLYREHPWLLHVGAARPVLGPNTTLKYEAELRPLDGLGISEVEMDSVLTLILTHVSGTARLLDSMIATNAESGMNDSEWWSTAAPILEKLIDPSRFPVASRVGTAAGLAHEAATDPIHALRFGLDRVLDGVAQLIELRRDGATVRR